VQTSQIEQISDNVESESDWVKTPVANLIRYKPSGVYFARVRIRGKLFRQPPKTIATSIAKLRLLPRPLYALNQTDASFRQIFGSFRGASI